MAAATLVLYLGAFGIPFFLGKHYTTPRLTWVIIAGPTLEMALAYTGVLVVLFALYYLGYRALAAAPTIPAWAIYLPPVAFGLVLLAIYPPGGWDLFLYISQGRLFSQHHLNPYLISPQDLSGELLYPYASWFPYPSTYGPAWTIISTLLSYLGGDNLWLSMLLFKGAASIFLLGDMVLVYLILAKIKPDWRHLGGFLLAWNPLVLFEIVGNGHNDAALVFFVLLAAFFLVKNRPGLVLPLLILSALVKYASIILLPWFLASLWHSRKRMLEKTSILVVNLAFSAVVLGLFLRPFEGGISLSSLVSMEDWFRSSPATLLMLALQGNFPPEQARTIAKAAAATAFAVVYLWQLLRNRAQLLQGLSLSSLFYGVYWSFFFVVLFIPWFVPWYFIWALAIAPLVADHSLNERIILLSFTAFLSHIVYYFISEIYGSQLNYFTIEAIANLVIFTPPLLHWWLTRRRQRLRLLAEKDGTIATQEEEIGRLRDLLSGGQRESRRPR